MHLERSTDFPWTGSPQKRSTSLHVKSPPTACRDGGARSKPRIAVVIPIFAREPQRLVQILTALEQLGRQKRPADFLVLVDDASPLPLPLNLGNEQVRSRPLAPQGHTSILATNPHSHLQAVLLWYSADGDLTLHLLSLWLACLPTGFFLRCKACKYHKFSFCLTAVPVLTGIHVLYRSRSCVSQWVFLEGVKFASTTSSASA